MAGRVISAVLKFRDQNFATGLRNANRQAGDFGRSVQVVQNQVETMSRRVKSGFKTVGVAAGALGAGAVAALGASVASSIIQMDEAFNKLEAQTGATGTQLASYKELAKEVFVNGFSESLTEASTSVGKLANTFKNLSSADLAAATKGSFTIAKTFDQEATEVGRAVKAMTDNFKNLDPTGATDLITVAFQKTGDYANDLLDTVSEYSGYFSAAGMDAEQFTSTLIKGAEVGAWNIDKVGDAVKEFGIRSIDGSKGTAEGFAAIGLNAGDMAKKMVQGGESANQAYMATIAGLANMKDEVARNQAGVALFGTQWEDLKGDVVLAMADSTSAVDGYQGATERAATALQSGAIARMKKAWRGLVTDLASSADGGVGKEFLDGLASAAENAVPVVLDLADKAMSFANTIRDNWPVIRETVIGITTAVVTFKLAMSAMTIISAVSGFIQAYRAALAAGTVAQWAMNTAMAANPIGLVIAGIAGLVAIGVVLYRNWDTVREKTAQLWDKLGSFTGVATIILGPLGQIIRAAVTMADNWDSTKSVWENVWNGIRISAANSINDVIGSINKLIGAINKIPGVNIPIIPKVEWGNVASKTKSISTAGPNMGPQLASFDVGTNRVARDMTANIHKDEMIIPARQAAKIRAGGGTIDNIDKLISKQPKVVSQTTSSAAITSTPSGNTFGDIYITAKGLTVAEVVGELVPQ
ncbi:MAG: phage tail tape measure protein, partial [Lysinibacillus sp.]